MEARLSATQLLQVTRDGLRDLGYRDDLLRSPYPFADVLLDEAPTRKIDLAAFAQDPPSYRSACFGVAVLEQYGPELLQQYRALGAPQLLVLSPASDVVRRWRMPAAGLPTFIEEITPQRLPAVFRANRAEWSPDAVLRAKAISFASEPLQLDFVDVGLLPALEGETHKKLDGLLRTVLATSKEIYAKAQDAQPDYEGLFRLIFRFIAAKMLADRGYPGDEWRHPDPQRVIAAVDAFYFHQAPDEALLQDREIQQAAWNIIRRGFHFQNLSVEALAYVYENTLVTERSRRVLDTHATPPQIAEYVVRQLPFELLPQEERHVFEPFAGHAPFLIAALGRLRTLLPAHMSASERHDYFVRMLSGMELDAFAREVARYSLILADYPNPNGWDIALDDVFTSPLTDAYLHRAKVVLCNPPFSDAPSRGSSSRNQTGAAKRAVEALNRVLRQPPAQLGFVLPKVFVSGQEYRDARRRLISAYQEIDVITLPDTVFQYSDVETALLIAHSKTEGSPRRRVASVSKPDYERFLQEGTPTWCEELPLSLVDAIGAPVFWRTPLWNIWETIAKAPRLGDVAEVHRGYQYKVSLREQGTLVYSAESREGFLPGLLNLNSNFEPYMALGFTYLNNNPEFIQFETYKHPWTAQKVIVNSARLRAAPVSSLRHLACAHAIPPQYLVAVQRRQYRGLWLERRADDELGLAPRGGSSHFQSGRDPTLKLRHVRDDADESPTLL